MPRSLRFTTQDIVARDGLSLRESVPAQDLQSADLPARLLGPVAVELDFSIGSSRVLLTGEFRGLWELPCSRCLKAFEDPYRGSIEETFGLTEPELDAGEEIRQGLLLAVPTKPLCRPDCKGLCALCGKDLNEGPCGCRLEAPSPFAKLRKPEH